jgi:hypothetical protein
VLSRFFNGVKEEMLRHNTGVEREGVREAEAL